MRYFLAILSSASWLFLFLSPSSDGFSFVLMARRGQGNLQRSLEDSDAAAGNNKQGVASLNKGKGQEITGVTLPAEGKVKGWEFGNGVRVACCNVNGRYFAIQGECPRCAFDLWKGDLIADDDAAWEDLDLPRVSCPTCSTTYSMRTGKYGPPLKRKGLQAFVSGLAKSATVNDAAKDAKAFVITVDSDEEGDTRVYCR